MVTVTPPPARNLDPDIQTSTTVTDNNNKNVIKKSIYKKSEICNECELRM